MKLVCAVRLIVFSIMSLGMAALCRNRNVLPDEPAGTTLGDSALSLYQCFTIAKRHNADLRLAVAGIEETRGETIVYWSRLLPHLYAVYGRAKSRTAEPVTGDLDQVLNDRAFATVDDEHLEIEIRQRIAEFGRTNDAEFQRMRRKCLALYTYEDRVVDVFSAIRHAYYSLKIIRQQLDSHDSLLAHYVKQLDRATERFEKGVSLKTMVLTARLNQLEEKERILRLRKSEREQLAVLKELLGLTRMPDKLFLTSDFTPVDISEDSCVTMALQRSTEIADKQAEAEFSRQRLRQWAWEFAPDISFSAGVRKNQWAAGFEVGRADTGKREWALDLVGISTIIEPAGEFFIPPDSLLRYTARVELRFPIFKGMQRYGTRVQAVARYSQARDDLIAKTRAIETRVRNAFYAYELALKHLQIREERVEIARERYELAEKMHELGRISDDGFDGFRERLFWAQDDYFELQFTALQAEETLRTAIRQLD